MGFMDLFRRKAEPNENRAAAQGYTADLIAARHEWLSGRSDVAELTATVQSCVSLWESGFTLADVKGTDLLDRRALAMLARALALRGEAVFLIRDRLVACTDWDMRTRNGEPTAYRVSVGEIGGGRSETALAAEVLHVRIGASMVTPWAGTAPLHRASLSAGLLQEVETALREVWRNAPIGSQIIPLPDSSAEDMAGLRASFRGARGQALIVEGVAQAVAAGMHPGLEKRVENLTPDLQRAMTAETLEAARGAICAAYGILPAWLNPATTGPAIRECQRQLATWTLQPLAELVAEEATVKLGTRVSIDVHRALQSFDAGGSARALAGIMQALATAKEAGLPHSTVAAAFKALDWSEAKG
ncbi:hypothetical protein IC63_14690 [Paracoccus sphaerophysae]|uniref:Phage portal protein n=2 Tax=Paracoccus sphaerophysae TaxID=690417 RepID=A0A099EW49_9RHOB|nr:phage portal protein [Paracoccus sphaerophysae]KGJ02444.1 hypothetical protein IC63_14690 [Paracoccus sphaerophysae]